MAVQTDTPKAANQAFTQAYAAYAGHANGAEAWLQPIRDRAIEAFSESGFPTVRDEDWKYTNLVNVAARSAAYLNAGVAAADIDVIKKILRELPISPDNYTIVFANGLYCEELSNLSQQDAALSIETLRGANERLGSQIKAHFGHYAEIENFQLAALNTAFLIDGLVVRVSDNSEISRPIHVVFVSDDQKVSVQPRILINVGESSRAMLIEHHVGRGAGLTNAVTEVYCAKGAHLRYIKIQEADEKAYHLAAQYVQLDRDSRFDAVHLDFGAELARNDLTVKLAGSGAEAHLHGLFVVDGRRHVDNHTRLEHIKGHTTSRESYRGILNDRGRGVFNGKVIVHRGADQTDAQLNNRNLLLSQAAEVDTKPELEIYTDDVKCGHGTTTGQLDTDAMFYLRARGIPEDEARRMLVRAFATEIIERIDAGGEAMLRHVEKALERRLPG